jgi:RHS repeat-associated protein
MHIRNLKENSSTPFSFNGMEKDDEVKGEGNSVNYKYRMCDPRVGRFFAVDPLTSKYPELTPYQFSSNSVVFMIELEGLEGVVYYHNFDKNTGKAKPKPGFSKEVEGLTENVAVTIHYKSNGEFDYAKARGNESGLGPTFWSWSAMTNDKQLALNFPDQNKQPNYVNNQSNPGIDPTYYDSWEGGDDGANTGNNAAGEQAPAAVKVIVGLIPIMSVYNAVTVLSTDKDMYGEEASSGWDKTMAIVSVFSVFGGVTKCATVAKASEKTINNSKKVDKVLEATSIADDAGAFDSE